MQKYDFLYVFNDNEIDIFNNNRVIGILMLAPLPKGKWAWLGEILKSVLGVKCMTFYIRSMIMKSISTTIIVLFAFQNWPHPLSGSGRGLNEI